MFERLKTIPGLFFPHSEAIREKADCDHQRIPGFQGAFLIFCGLVVAAISFAILVGATPIRPDFITTASLVTINLAFILLLSVLIEREIRRIGLRRKSEQKASRLHVRIVSMFALIATIPAILVAVVAAITLHIGLDRWFEIRTRAIVNHSLSIADAYVLENARNLLGTSLSMAQDLDSHQKLYNLDPQGFFELMSEQAAGRALDHAALIHADGSLAMQAYTEASFELPTPPKESVEVAIDGRPVLIEPQISNIVGAIIKLRKTKNLYLYTVRLVDPEVIKARQIVHANVREYRDMQNNRITSQLAFALPYTSLALTIVLSSIWIGMALSDRLVRPVRELIAAAGKVSKGNLDVSVHVSPADGDVAVLGQTFNQMILKLHSQRDELMTAKDMIDERRRFSEAVLSGVTVGVIGVNPEGIVTIINPSAEAIFGILASEVIGQDISVLLPEIGRIFIEGYKSGKPIHREQVTFPCQGKERILNTQITIEHAEAKTVQSSYVVTVDDITDLVQAQRLSAWADIARRIAHEIKNPLTPIRLSAERISRKYRKMISEDCEIFDRCIETIIRQVEDIGCMVNEFAAFARMPKPEMRILDIKEPLREAIFLLEVSCRHILFQKDFEDRPLPGKCDSRLLAQAFGNIIKNATESIDSCREREGVIWIRARYNNGNIRVDVIDNGAGFPQQNRQKLLEPYVTTREKGTGLGFPIVYKIIEEHGGSLELNDVPPEYSFTSGAMVSLILPASGSPANPGKPARTSKEEKTV